MVRVSDENHEVFKKVIAVPKVKINVVRFYLMHIFFLISLTSSKLDFLWSFWAAIAFFRGKVTKVKTSEMLPCWFKQGHCQWKASRV